MSRSVEIMVTGDLHLGIHPTKIPGEYVSETFSPGEVWNRTVDEAISRDINAMVLTGDIADRENQSLEAWGPLEAGVANLAEADIPIVMVSGNHDAGFLERIVDSINRQNLHLIGRNGEWERFSIESNGENVLHLDGWSYPRERVRNNPLEDYNLPEANEPTLGMLHTQLDSPDSPYAPVATSDLENSQLNGWLLGHIHDPGVRADSPPVLYPGSPQPLNPTETGVHGPWLLEVGPSRVKEPEILPLATLEYLGIDIDVEGLSSPEAVLGETRGRIESILDGRNLPNSRRDLILARLTLTGVTDHYENLMDEWELSGKEFQANGISVVIESVQTDVRPRLDLEKLAEGTGLVSQLANILKSVEDGSNNEEARELLERVKSCWTETINANAFQPLQNHRDNPGRSPDEETLREELLQQGRQLLYKLRSQKEGDDK